MNISDKYQLIFFHLPKCAGRSVVNALDIKTSDKTNIKTGLGQTTLLGFEIAGWNNRIYPEKWNNYIKFTIIRNPWDRVVSLYHFRKKENDLYKLFPPAFGMNIVGGDKVGPDNKEWDFKRWILSSFVKGLTVNQKATTVFVDNKGNEHPLLVEWALELDSQNLEDAIEHHRFFTEEDNYIKLCNSKDTMKTIVGENKLEEEVNGYQLFVRDRIEWFNQIDIISGLRGEKLVDYILRFEHLEEMWNRMFEELGYEPPKLPKKNVSKHKHYSEYYDDETRDFVGKLFEKDIKEFGYEYQTI